MKKLFCIGSLMLALIAHAEGEKPGPVIEGCRVPMADSQNLTPVEQERWQRQLFAKHQSKTIGEIHYRNADVFDETNEAESNALYHLLNKLHIHTLEDVIAAQLLFAEGARLDADAVAESERLLRSRGYLANAYITLSQVCEGYVVLTVHTQDAWTTEPEISFGHSGGETSSGLALSEDNFLGTGSSISIGYSKDADRSGISYHFSSPHFLNTRLAASLGYTNSSDGEDSIISLALPFYSLKTPSAFGIKAENISLLEPIRYEGEVVNEFRHAIEYREIYFGKAISIKDNYTHRLLVGITEERDHFTATPETLGTLPENTELSYPWLEYQLIENKFAVYRNIDQIQRTEDIAMGKTLTLRLGYGGESWGNADDVLRYIGKYSDVLALGEKQLVKFSAYVDGRKHSHLDDMDSSVVGAELSWYFLRDPNNRWFARLRYDVGNDLQIHEQLTVGGVAGVRGYPLDFQRGDQRYIFSLERRYFSDVHLFNLLYLGAVVFFDTGRAWGGTREPSPQHLSNVGFGLRISSSKAHIGQVIHIDVAFPTADKQDASSVQWLIVAEQSF